MSDDTCTDCGGPVRWVLTEGGRRVELDPDPHPDGNVVPTVDATGHRRARVLTGVELPAEGPAWRRHSSTCPESAEAKARRARLAPRCSVCNLPMHPGLARLEDWDTHPCCDPREGADRVRAARAAATEPPAPPGTGHHPQEGNPVMRSKLLDVAAAVVVVAALTATGGGVALASATAPAAGAAKATPTATKPVITTKRTAPVVGSSHVTSVRKATPADVASGFAASTAATVYGCSGRVSLDDPDTGTLTSKLSVAVAWQESVTTSARPEARVSAGTNAVFITDNQPVNWWNTWSFTGWRNRYNPTSPYGYATAWKTFVGGTTIAVSVDNYGNITTTGWSNNNVGAGFRTFLENVPNASQTPELPLTLTGAANTLTERLNIYADGNCGTLVLL